MMQNFPGRKKLKLTEDKVNNTPISKALSLLSLYLTVWLAFKVLYYHRKMHARELAPTTFREFITIVSVHNPDRKSVV